MRGTVVGVLRGGPSSEHAISLKSGHAVVTNLPSDRYTVRDIFIDPSGVWHERGLPTSPERVLPTLDVIFAPIHGAYGEDGTLQKILERFGVPYIGPNSYHAYTASHKVMAKEIAKQHGIQTPKYRFIERIEDAENSISEVVRTFQQPVVIKPVSSGSSVGIAITGGFKPILNAVTALLDSGSPVFIEERIRGTEATVGVIERMRDEPLYALPVIEIIPPAGHEFFSYDAKYSGKSQEICPGRFSKQVSEQLAEAAKTMHQALGQRHYSRSDFIVSPKGVYFLELNNAPAVGLTSESLFPKGLASVGITYPDFLSHVISLALGERRR